MYFIIISILATVGTRARLLLLPGVILAVPVLVSPLEVLELLSGPGVLEVLLLVGLVHLGVRQTVLHHVLKAPDQTCFIVVGAIAHR